MSATDASENRMKQILEQLVQTEKAIKALSDKRKEALAKKKELSDIILGALETSNKTTFRYKGWVFEKVVRISDLKLTRDEMVSRIMNLHNCSKQEAESIFTSIMKAEKQKKVTSLKIKPEAQNRWVEVIPVQ